MTTMLLLFMLNACPGWGVPEWVGNQVWCEDQLREPQAYVAP